VGQGSLAWDGVSMTQQVRLGAMGVSLLQYGQRGEARVSVVGMAVVGRNPRRRKKGMEIAQRQVSNVLLLLHA